MKKEEHGLNQCANDWIMCKCGKLFGDTKMSAKSKFIRHLRIKGIDEIIIMGYLDCIKKTNKKGDWK